MKKNLIKVSKALALTEFNIPRVMKLTSLCGLLCVSSAFATQVNSQTMRVNINANQKQAKEIIKQIEEQTDYLFVYNKKVNLNHTVSISANNETVAEVLDRMFAGTDIVYAVQGNNILLMHRSAAPQQGEKKIISGTILDEAGIPVIGANVIVQGTTNGTITDMDGKFSLEVTPDAVLEISYIGYSTQSIPVGSQTNFNVTLQEDSETLDELVVVGYGTMKKKDLTGAMSALKGDDLASRRTTQLSTALQGATSGVLVTRDNSAPGATASIRIRGVTTIGETSPLVIVDGVPGDINQVNPEDVENISVLKDAASASIYGSRAAAGVIVITTKRAKADDLSLSYNFEYGWEMPTELPKYVGAQRFLEMTNETRYNDNNAGGWYQTYSEDQVNNWVRYNATDPDNYPMVDWQDVLLKSSAPRQTHSVNIAGGSKVVKSKASFRYDKTDGLYENRNYERFMVRVNNDIQVNKWIAAHLDVNFNRASDETPHANPLAAGIRATPPIYAVRWSNGSWGDVKDGENALAVITDGGTKKTWSTQVGGKAGLDITPIEGLKISAIVAPNYYFTKIKNFTKQVPYTYANDPNTVRGYMFGTQTTNLKEERNDNYDITSQIFANYDRTFGKHSLSVMVGYEDYFASWENLTASRDQYELKDYPYLDVGPETYRDNSGNAEEYAYRSFFGRVAYSYDNRYLIQANFRRDGSSRFAADSRWANFPSFSAGWVLSEEQFMKDLNLDWLSYLKLRGSWGTLGNERITDVTNEDDPNKQNYYPYQSAIIFGSSLFYKGNTATSLTTGAQQAYAVRDITWETTETWDVGLDAQFLDSRLTFAFDYYQKHTRDMLIATEIPSFIGYDNPYVNAGRMDTKGYDIEIGWRDQIGEFSYSVSANLSDFVSRMGDLGGTEYLGDQVKMEGSEFNEWYGYLSDGLFQTVEEVANSPKLNDNVTVGDIKYKDISGPDGVPDGIISPEYDRVLLGGSLPRYMYGVNLSASWKGFDLSLMFQGVGKQNARIAREMVEGLNANWSGFPELLEGNYWSVNNTAEQNLEAKYPRLTRNNVEANMAMSDYWLFNGRYVRLKNLTIGYTLPTELTKKASIDMVRFYVSGNDLFCISKYPHGWDPEVSATGYPITSSVLLGVSVNF